MEGGGGSILQEAEKQILTCSSGPRPLPAHPQGLEQVCCRSKGKLPSDPRPSTQTLWTVLKPWQPHLISAAPTEFVARFVSPLLPLLCHVQIQPCGVLGQPSFAHIYPWAKTLCGSSLGSSEGRKGQDLLLSSYTPAQARGILFKALNLFFLESFLGVQHKAGSERKGYSGLHSSCTPSYTKTKGQCGREEKWLLSLQLIQNKGGAFSS